jgi:hypothetical protein
VPDIIKPGDMNTGGGEKCVRQFEYSGHLKDSEKSMTARDCATFQVLTLRSMPLPNSRSSQGVVLGGTFVLLCWYTGVSTTECCSQAVLIPMVRCRPDRSSPSLQKLPSFYVFKARRILAGNTGFDHQGQTLILRNRH